MVATDAEIRGWSRRRAIEGVPATKEWVTSPV